MKSVYLLFYFTFGLFYAVDAQIDELKTFTNYGSCYQGLKSAKGEVLWPADFESIMKVWDYDCSSNPRRFFWVAEKNGSFGLIDHEGKLILPFKYNRITSFTDGIIAADHNAAYLLSRNGKITWELPDYSWIRPTSTGYIVEQNDKVGFLDLAHDEVLPTTFDRIDFCYIRRQGEATPEIVSNRFLDIQLDEKQGVFDLIQNKWVIPFTSLTIDPAWVTFDPYGDENEDYFCSNSDAVFRLIDQATGTSKVVNSIGNQTLPFGEYHPYDFDLTPIDSCGMESHQMAYLEENGKMRVVNLKTGQSSKEYPYIFPFGGRSLIFEDKKWGVLDTNFNELNRFPYSKKMLPQIQPRPGIELRRVSEWHFDALFSERHERNSDSVMIIQEPFDQKDLNQYPYYNDQYYGLVNFRTAKKVKSRYHWIRKVDFEGASYYWATTIFYLGGEAEQSITAVDIFNSELKLLNQFDKETQFGQAAKAKSNPNIIVFRGEKAGVINPRGDFIIPMEYTEIIHKEVQIKEYLLDKQSIFIAKKNGESTVYDVRGNVLIETSNRNFEVERSLIRAHREDQLMDLYNYKGQLILEGAKKIWMGYLTDSLGNCLGVETWPQMTPGFRTYIIKEDRLYALLSDSIQLLDQNFFKFTQNYCFFLEWIVIDKNGKIITTNPQGIPKRYIPNDPSNRYKCSSYVDEYPIPQKKTQAQTPVQEYTPSPKKYSWKQHDRKNPNEWFLYNGNNKLLYPEPFEYPLRELVFSGGVFKQNGKYGYFDAHYNKRLDAEYDFIYPYFPLTLKNGLWQLHDFASEKVSQGFDEISLNKLNNVRFVFHEGKIGLLNDSMQLETPLMDSIEFLAKYDLAKMSNLNGDVNKKNIRSIRGIIYDGVPKEVYRQINNVNILEQAYLNSTANDHLRFSPVDSYRNDLPYGLKNLVIYHNAYSLKRERRPTFYNAHFYSEMTLSRSESLSNNLWDELGNSDQYKFKEFTNYKIEGTELVPIQLDDILKTDANSTIKLNELMIRELNKIQAFGENCTDIEDKLAQLKENFILNRSNITFYWNVLGGFQIQLLFKEINDLFLYPKKMLF